jgi:hypothetical protein
VVGERINKCRRTYLCGTFYLHVEDMNVMTERNINFMCDEFQVMEIYCTQYRLSHRNRCIEGFQSANFHIFVMIFAPVIPKGHAV